MKFGFDCPFGVSSQLFFRNGKGSSPIIFSGMDRYSDFLLYIIAVMFIVVASVPVTC